MQQRIIQLPGSLAQQLDTYLQAHPQETLSSLVQTLIATRLQTSTPPRTSIDILNDIYQRRPAGRPTRELNRQLQAERDAWDS